MSLYFLGIGAQKAGTTWLYKQLLRHPEIYFPLGKEVHFWNSRRGQSYEWYDSNYDNPLLKGGDITPAYAILGAKSVYGIYKRYPHLKIIFILRDPIERAWSAARFKIKWQKLDRSTLSDDWFYQEFASTESFLRGYYQRTIAIWLQYFPAEHLLAISYDDIAMRPERLLKKTSEFLNIKPFEGITLPELKTKVNSSTAYPLPDHYRRYLECLYSTMDYTDLLRKYGSDL